MSEPVVVNGERKGVMQNLVDFLLLFPTNFEKFDPPDSTSELFAEISTVAPKISNRPHCFVPTAFQNPPKDSRTLINVQSVVVRPAQDIINVQSMQLCNSTVVKFTNISKHRCSASGEKDNEEKWS
jgi:hypothetical protein